MGAATPSQVRGDLQHPRMAELGPQRDDPAGGLATRYGRTQAGPPPHADAPTHLRQDPLVQPVTEWLQRAAAIEGLDQQLGEPRCPGARLRLQLPPR